MALVYCGIFRACNIAIIFLLLACGVAKGARITDIISEKGESCSFVAAAHASLCCAPLHVPAASFTRALSAYVLPRA
jgi:hypothetical protein